MPTPIVLLVLFAALLHASWNALVKGGTDRFLDTTLVVTAAAVVTLPCLPFLAPPPPAVWPFLAISTAAQQAYFALIARAYREGDMSLVYPLTRGAAPVLTAVAAAVVLAERPTAGTWIGVLLVAMGALLLATEAAARVRNGGGASVAPAIGIALANAAVVMTYTLADGVGVRRAGDAALGYAAWSYFLTAAVFTPAAFALRGRDVVRRLRGGWARGLAGGVCTVASYSLALWAMTRAPIASVAALRETSIVFGTILAALVLRERVTPTRVAAVALIAAGAVAVKVL